MNSRSGKPDVEKPAGGFSKLKKDFLSKPDKSGIGGIDEDIRKLVDIINESPLFYTTSSCAGRIVLMLETGEKQENAFVFVTHKKTDPKKIVSAIKMDPRVKKNLIYLKEEPCILHVACNDPLSAQALVSLARNCGWKKSGIISIKRDKIMIECISTEILAAPISNNGKMLISEDYLDLLVKECNTKLLRTREKIKKLEKAFKLLR